MLTGLVQETSPRTLTLPGAVTTAESGHSPKGSKWSMSSFPSSVQSHGALKVQRCGTPRGPGTVARSIPLTTLRFTMAGACNQEKSASTWRMGCAARSASQRSRGIHLPYSRDSTGCVLR